jgi:hypothetical protein
MDDRATIDFIILANHVEAVNGLLYISGGGWTDHWRTLQPGSPPPSSRLAIGVSIRIPWMATNQVLALTMRVEDADGAAPLVTIRGEFNVGRPPHLPPGSEQHAGFSFEATVTFPAPGEYRVVAELNDGEDVRRWPFRVHDRTEATVQ